MVGKNRFRLSSDTHGSVRKIDLRIQISEAAQVPVQFRNRNRPPSYPGNRMNWEYLNRPLSSIRDNWSCNCKRCLAIIHQDREAHLTSAPPSAEHYKSARCCRINMRTHLGKTSYRKRPLYSMDFRSC